MAKKMLHTCVRVKDLDTSITFYQDAFGFKEVSRRDFPDHQFPLVYLGFDGDDYELELTYNYGHPGYELGTGYGHIAISSDNLEADHARHEAAGYPVTKIGGLPDELGLFYFITDPDGYKIEVIRTQV